VRKAKNTQAAGDITYVRAGTYAEGQENYGTMEIFTNAHNGLLAAKSALVGYPGETAILDGGGGTRVISNPYGNNGPNNYTFANLTLRNAVREFEFLSGATTTHIRIVALTMYSVRSGNGCHEIDAGMTDHVLYGSDVYNCDASGVSGYSLYWGGYGTQDTIDVGWNYLHDNTAGKAIQFYGHTPGDQIRNVRVHDNFAYNNCKGGFSVGGADGGSDIFNNSTIQYFYNNVFVYNGGCFPDGYRRPGLYFLSTNSPTGTFKAWNNTFYRNGGAHPNTGCCATDLTNAGVASLDVTNNIFYADTTSNGCMDLEGSGSSSQVSGSNNLFFNCTTPSFLTSGAISATNPQFVNPGTVYGTADFHLLSTSPAIGAGATSPLLLVIQDIAGLLRPSPPSVGAYEFSAGTTAQRPAAPTNLQVIVQ
jgi:hypothetical protein